MRPSLVSRRVLANILLLGMGRGHHLSDFERPTRGIRLCQRHGSLGGSTLRSGHRCDSLRRSPGRDFLVGGGSGRKVIIVIIIVVVVAIIIIIIILGSRGADQHRRRRGGTSAIQGSENDIFATRNQCDVYHSRPIRRWSLLQHTGE